MSVRQPISIPHSMIDQYTSDFHRRILALSRTPRTVDDYLRSIIDEAPSGAIPAARAVVCEAVQRRATESLGEFGDGVGDLVRRPGTVVSFGEHHAPLTHPLTMGAVAFQSLYALRAGTRLVHLSCGSVPLDNELFPRGLVIGGRKVPFLPGRHRRRVVLRCPPLDHELFAHNLRRLHDARVLDRRDYARLSSWWQGLAPELDRAGGFWQQVAVLNRRCYEAIFEVGLPAPVMVPLELVAQDVLLADLAAGRETWLERCLFRPAARSALLAALDGVRCFWRRATGRGTFLFWHAGPDGRLTRLFPDGGHLVTPAGDVRHELRAEAVRAGLLDGTLLPAASYALLRLLFQAGLRSFGGPLQYDYIGNARHRLLTGLRDHLTPAESHAVDTVPLSYYVNFAEHKTLHGELARITDPITRADLARIGALRLDALAGADLEWIDDTLAQY
jgi:hypothetical protein